MEIFSENKLRSLAREDLYKIKEKTLGFSNQTKSIAWRRSSRIDRRSEECRANSDRDPGGVSSLQREKTRAEQKTEEALLLPLAGESQRMMSMNMRGSTQTNTKRFAHPLLVFMVVSFVRHSIDMTCCGQGSYVFTECRTRAAR
jgi:hypothetical protein